MMGKVYDRRYFDRWYRDPAHALDSPAAVRRKLAMVLALAEHYLGRPVRSVLDVGCGEAAWRAPLRALRPGIAYQGLDPSGYAVARYGRARQIGLARFGELAYLRPAPRYDVIVCSNVLHYIRAGEIRAGLPGIVDMLEGVAFLEVFTRADDVIGDRENYVARSPAWYLRAFADAGLVACGSQCYLGPSLRGSAAALEICAAGATR